MCGSVVSGSGSEQRPPGLASKDTGKITVITHSHIGTTLRTRAAPPPPAPGRRTLGGGRAR
jgi:hypothetical protein